MKSRFLQRISSAGTEQEMFLLAKQQASESEQFAASALDTR